MVWYFLLHKQMHCSVFLLFVLEVFANHAIPLHQLHTAIATEKDELLRLFETNSVLSVPEYEVVPVVRHRNRRDLSSKRHYKLSAFGKDFHLELEPNDVVVSKTFVVTRKKPGNVWTKELYKPIGTFYQGHVVSDSQSHVALRELERPGEMTGAIFSDGHVYRLHPLTDKVKKKLSLKRHQEYHVVTKKSMKHTTIPGFFPEPVEDPLRSDVESVKRRRVRRAAGPKYIEAMILLDKVSSDHYGNTSMDFVLSVANMVHRLYRHKSIGIDVGWILTNIHIMETDEEGLDFNKQNIRSATDYLKVFSTWAKAKNPPAGSAGHYDNGVLLSRRLCGLESCSLGGVAYSGVPCSDTLGYSVNNGNGIDASFYIAHEMGHNFGIPHDSGECNKGYIMAPGQSGGPNAFRWSPCSNEMFKSVFNRVTCYDNKPPKDLNRLDNLPGYNYDANRQCQMMHGSAYKECPITQNDCSLLFCYRSGGCSSSGTPPIDGTPCGKRKWCVGGLCEDVGSSLPPLVDGGWGAWGGSYSSCSRTCGVGVQYRTRECNNPKPQFGGKTCPGSSIGDWKTCNKQDCPKGSEHYRLYQCKQKKAAYNGYYIREGAECYLSCTAGEGSYTIEGPVADGTKYSDNSLDYDLCIAGKRVEAGCDHEINSGSKLDRCAKCSGDGSTCKRISALYDATGQPWGINKAVAITTIPSGATHFHIEEVEATTNILNLKLSPPGSNSLLLPQRPSNMTIQTAGVTIIHRSTSTDLALARESMSFVGPSTAALCPMYVQVLYDKNKGYKYSYYLPGQGASTTFVWKAVPFGSCSESCATGYKAQNVMCVRNDDATEVSRKFCDLGNKPEDKIPCNTQACAAQWEPELWGQCSQRCGGGERKRLVPCVEKVSSDIYRNVEYYYCNISVRPHQNESCNNIPCGASWKMGDWSECVSGKADRKVECIDVLSDGTVVPLDPSKCNTVGIDLTPQTLKNCTVKASAHHIRSCAFTSIPLLLSCLLLVVT